jgi:hypothetical protein
MTFPGEVVTYNATGAVVTVPEALEKTASY